MSEPRKFHLARLDVLRGLAVGAVVIFHFFIGIFGSDGLAWSGYWLDFRSSPHPLFFWFYPCSFGWAGVSLFFVLSGFCIQWSFLNRDRFSIEDFFAARFWRIFPAYFVALIVFIMLTRTSVTTVDGCRQILTHLLLIHNFSNATIFGINPSFWSLAVEAQFYLAFPLLLWLRAKFGINASLAIAGGLSLILRIIFLCSWNFAEALPLVWRYHPVSLWFDWILGAFVAERFYRGSPPLPFSFPFTLVFLSGLFVFTTCYKPATLFSFTIASLISALVLDRVLRSQHSLFSWERPWARLGIISYSIYLWHQPILVRVIKLVSLVRLPGGKASLILVAFPLTAAAVFVCGTVSYRALETLGIKIKNRRATKIPIALSIPR